MACVDVSVSRTSVIGSLYLGDRRCGVFAALGVKNHANPAKSHRAGNEEVQMQPEEVLGVVHRQRFFEDPKR